MPPVERCDVGGRIDLTAEQISGFFAFTWEAFGRQSVGVFFLLLLFGWLSFCALAFICICERNPIGMRTCTNLTSKAHRQAHIQRDGELTMRTLGPVWMDSLWLLLINVCHLFSFVEQMKMPL